MQELHAAVAANLPVFIFHPAERCAANLQAYSGTVHYTPLFRMLKT